MSVDPDIGGYCVMCSKGTLCTQFSPETGQVSSPLTILNLSDSTLQHKGAGEERAGVWYSVAAGGGSGHQPA